MGLSRNKANQLINRYHLVINYDDMTGGLIEELPVSLTYEIAKPSAESTPAKAQAKAEVLNGDIDTLKKYRERIAELERENAEKEQRAQQAEQRERMAQRDADILRDKLESIEEKEPEIRKKFSNLSQFWAVFWVCIVNGEND